MPQIPENTEYTLILNACEGVLQIVCAGGGRMLMSQEWYMENQATEILAPQLAAACRSLGLQPASFTRIACVCGPGSFTGIRLVLSTAAGLATVSGAGRAGLSYLAALACEAGLREPRCAGRICLVCTHARRSLVHAQAFSLEQGGLPVERTGIVLCDPKELIPMITEDCILVGSALQRYPEVFSSLRTDGASPLLLPGCVQPSPEALLLLSREAVYGRNDIEPVYIRPCDAVDNLERLAARYGIGAEEAQRSFREILARDPVQTV